MYRYADTDSYSYRNPKHNGDAEPDSDSHAHSDWNIIPDTYTDTLHGNLLRRLRWRDCTEPSLRLDGIKSGLWRRDPLGHLYNRSFHGAQRCLHWRSRRDK